MFSEVKNAFGLFFFAAKNRSFPRSFFVLLCFYEVFGVPRGIIFGTSVAQNKLCFWVKRWDPRFEHHYSVLAWFSRSPASRGQQKERQKTACKNDQFLEVHKNRSFIKKNLKMPSLWTPRRTLKQNKNIKKQCKNRAKKNLLEIEKAVLPALDLNSSWKMCSHAGKTLFLSFRANS